jgi:hypothetical protein
MTELEPVQLTPKERELLTIIRDPVRFCEKILQDKPWWSVQTEMKSPAQSSSRTQSAVFKAYHKAMDRQPAIDAEVFRKEDTARCEDMFLKLQRGISNGDPRHIDTAVRVLAHKAKLNGYTLESEQSAGLVGLSITINLGPEEK